MLRIALCDDDPNFMHELHQKIMKWYQESGYRARQKNLCKRREAVVKETGANQRISQAGHTPA